MQIAEVRELGFGEFPPGHQPRYLVLRAQDLGREIARRLAEAPIIGDSRFLVGLAQQVVRLASLVARAVRPILSRLLHLTHPVSTTVLALESPVGPGVMTSNNSMLLSPNSEETTRWRMDLLKSAEQSFLVSGNYCGGQVFQELLEEVDRQLLLKRDLKVFILSSEELLEEANNALIDQLLESYPERFHLCRCSLLCELFPKPRTIENHVKLTVVDEKYFIVGGTGISDHLCTEGSTPPVEALTQLLAHRVVAKAARDMDVVGRGDLAMTLAMEFFKLYAVYEHRGASRVTEELVNHHFPLDMESALAHCSRFEESQRLVSGVRGKISVCGSEHPENQCTAEYLRLLSMATRSCRLAQMNLNPVKRVRRALRRLPDGVHLELVTNGIGGNAPGTNHFFAWSHLKHYLPLFLRAPGPRFWTSLDYSDSDVNTAVYEYDVEGVLYHKKVLTVDDRITAIGSYNISYKSHCCDHELLLTVESEELTAQVNAVLDEDRNLSRPVSMEQAAHYYHSPLYHSLSHLQKALMGPFVV